MSSFPACMAMLLERDGTFDQVRVAHVLRGYTVHWMTHSWDCAIAETPASPLDGERDDTYCTVHWMTHSFCTAWGGPYSTVGS